MDFKIGCDPEFFLKKNGKFVSAYGLIGGTKKDPIKVERGAVQVDGMALEFNIDPVDNFKDFNENINVVLAQLRDMVPKDYDFVFTPVAEFGADYISKQPLEASRLGCDPDFNAWEGGIPNPTPDASMAFRTASGHIHIGWTENQDITDPDHIEACQMMVKQLDCILGLASVIWDPDTTRRQLYGKAGSYRVKPYGVEYRVMSNVWLNREWSRRFVFEQAKKAFDKLMKGQQWFNQVTGTPAYINNSDWNSAYYALDYHQGYFEELHNLYNKLTNKKYKEDHPKAVATAEAFYTANTFVAPKRKAAINKVQVLV